MSKRQLSSGLVRDVHNINAISFSDKIKMIPLEKVLPNERNFYRIDDDEVELLAEDIHAQGLKHNLVVKQNDDDTYTLISGHKRHEAIKRLVKNKGYTPLLPCFVEHYEDEYEELKSLIMLNVTNRKLTDSELIQGYEQLKEVFERKKKLGEISGRIRSLIANELGVSDSQLKKIDNINNNAIDEIITAVRENEMSINTADKLAKLSHEQQKNVINEDECKNEEVGTNTHNHEQHMNKKSNTNKHKKNKFSIDEIVNVLSTFDYTKGQIDEIIQMLKKDGSEI